DSRLAGLFPDMALQRSRIDDTAGGVPQEHLQLFRDQSAQRTFPIATGVRVLTDTRDTRSGTYKFYHYIQVPENTPGYAPGIPAWLPCLPLPMYFRYPYRALGVSPSFGGPGLPYTSNPDSAFFITVIDAATRIGHPDEARTRRVVE